MGYAATQQTVKPVPTQCPTCGGALWDNRSKPGKPKQNPKAPDFKCRDKNCNGVFWPSSAKDRFVWADEQGTPVTPINPAVGDLPGDPASAYAPTLPQHQPLPPTGLTPALRSLYADCVQAALGQAAVLIQNGVTVDGQAVASMAATLFIQANGRR